VRLPGLPTGLLVPLGRRLPPNVRRLANLARGIDSPALLDRPPARRIAVLAPHPDDELLGCGGTLPKHLAAGEAVSIIFMTSGERTASFAGRAMAERIAQRESEARTACAAAGLADASQVFLRLADGGVDASGRSALVAALVASEADLVYAPNPVDAHRDHVATTALLASALAAVPTVTHVALYEVWTPLYPNCLVDVTATMGTKLAGLGCYASALAVVDYRHTAEGLAAYRSGQGLHGAGYAEAFCVLTRAAFAEVVERGGGSTR